MYECCSALGASTIATSVAIQLTTVEGSPPLNPSIAGTGKVACWKKGSCPHTPNFLGEVVLPNQDGEAQLGGHRT